MLEAQRNLVEDHVMDALPYLTQPNQEGNIAEIQNSSGEVLGEYRLVPITDTCEYCSQTEESKYGNCVGCGAKR